MTGPVEQLLDGPRRGPARPGERRDGRPRPRGLGRARGARSTDRLGPRTPGRGGIAGSGITAFDAGGRRLWHADRPQLVWAFVVGDRVFASHLVQRHTQVEVYALADGAPLGSVFQRGTGMVSVTGAILPAGA